MKTFEELSEKEKIDLENAMPLGLVEVHCPWWCKGHWEDKIRGPFFDEAFYRLKEKKAL
jgi:hypothetical protein